MSVSKFYRIPHAAEAIRVSDKNMEEVVKWCGGEIVPANTAGGLLSYFGMGRHERVISVPTKDGFITVEVGEWLVRESRDGVFFRLSHEDFIAYYQPDRKAVYDGMMDSLMSAMRSVKDGETE